MKNNTILLILFVSALLPAIALGQDLPASKANTNDDVDANEAVESGLAASDDASARVEPAVERPALLQENTLAQCQDNKDNDSDGHVDCADQDCGIFVICANDTAGGAPSPAADNNAPVSEAPEKDTAESLVHRPFSIGFVPGLSTDSAASGEVLNHFSLNFIGWQDHLHGAEFSILGAIRKGNVRGFQGSHLFNVTLGEMHGLQGSGLVNITGGHQSGLQGAGFVNVAGKSARGIQGSGLVNFSGGPTAGIQGAGLANVANGDMSGFQGAGLANVAGGSMSGIQGAGLVNVSGAGGKGVQASGIANVAVGDFRGLQLGLVNFGTHVTGAQVGLVNIAGKSMKGAAFGLVNFAGDGVFAPTVWMAPASMLNLGLKMGSKHFYSILGAGVHPIGDNRRTSSAFGFGAHGDLSQRFWLEFDLMHNHLHDQKANFDSYDVDFIEQARLNLGFRFANDFSLYAGPSLDVLVSEVRDESGFTTFYTHNARSSSDTNVAISVGMTAGIQWEPKIGNLNHRD